MDDHQVSRDATEDVEIVAAAAVELSDVETFCVALATDEHGEKFGLSFQVPLSGEYDDQERRLEMNTYSISDNLGRTAYGGILAWAADPAASVLTITFSQSVVSVLDVEETLRFHLPSDKFDEVVEGFRRVLAGDEQGFLQPEPNRESGE
ncbi:hypothetical protein Asp14428_78210 [Actinoplanes sp. NBRC 14428]|uniref:Imm10 family immunity protein n=1 Tax=Pseudosporangium ferrugineum TaxID=439699 RepID=UPI000D0829AA|nr:Imm10 family immunity protein [Pseudosporangium ferrugineum]BCJ56346.1 hypothetical protein Asp14428_78210 [Actinoplanes sp. NBRC 14428]